MSFIVRASRGADLDDVLSVAEHLDSVNLPAERELLAEILVRSEQAFNEAVPPVEREYVFVLEEVETGRIIGTSMIHAQHGKKRAPHVFFHVLREERYSQTIDRYMVHECLRIGYNYHGPTEIGGLALLPEFRGHPDRLGQLLSYVRFLFIGMHRSVFRDQVLSELMPPLEPDGTSRLWKHLGHRFTGLTYAEADRISQNNKEFIESLFPHGLIYTSLFPEAVRVLIGKVGPGARGVEKMLRRIGFEYANKIDPFDGGPHFMAETDRITPVRHAYPFELGEASATDYEPSWSIVASELNGPASFRATPALVPGWRSERADDRPPTSATLALPEGVGERLGLASGDSGWVVTPS